MAAKIIELKPGETKKKLNTVAEATIGGASYQDTYIVNTMLNHIESVQIFYKYAELTHTDGKIHVYEAGDEDMDYNELINSAPDTDQEAVPILMNSAAGNGSILIETFLAPLLKVTIEKVSNTGGSVLLSICVKYK